MRTLRIGVRILPIAILAALLLIFADHAHRASAGPPPEFEKLPFLSGLVEPISFRFMPDGSHILVAEKGGTVRLFHMDGTEEPPFLTLTVPTVGEQGLIAIELDPAFLSNGDVFVYYTTPAGFNRLSKFTSFDGGHTANPASEVVLLESDVPSGEFHHGGDIRASADGSVWLTMGDNLNGPNAQNLSNMHGKILRVNKDGTIPSDNPFVNNPNAEPSIWAYGLRNPFRMELLPDGTPLVADVGESAYEELNIIAKGANYGWPVQEGPCQTCPYANPAFSYFHTEGFASVTASLVYTGSTFPPEYDGVVFYGDYALGEIRYLAFDQNYQSVVSDHDFDLDAGTVVDMQQGPDGNLYYLNIYPGEMFKVAPSGGNRAPIVQASANPTAGLLPLTVDFSSNGTYDPDDDSLSYLWDFGDGATSTSPNPAHQYTTAPAASPPTDTIGYWTFDQPPGSATATDSSGNGYHGALVNMNQATAWGPGKVGGAITFDGLNDYVSTPFTTNLSAWTVGAWVKSPAAPALGPSNSPIYRGEAFHFHWNHEDTAHLQGATVNVGGTWYSATFGALQANTWYYLAATYDGETLKAYRDGSLITANTTPSAPPNPETTPLVFANHSGIFWSGSLDEARLYGRALSPQEIISLAGGDVYYAAVTVSDGQKTTTKTIDITVGNQAPTGTISTPTEGSNYNAGATISFSGSATDPQDGALPASAFSWKVIFHHLQHTHPYLGPITGVSSGNFTISTDEHNDANTWYRIELTVTDSRGLKHVTSKSIYPNLVQLTINASPAGAQFTVDGHPHTAQLSEQAVVGVERVVDGPSPQFIGTVKYKFDSWSDGGLKTHTIVTPSTNSSYTATFVPWPAPPPPWVETAVGDPLPGSAEYSNGVFTITGAGDIWADDDFQYLYQPLNGNGEIIARVTSQTNSHEWAKAGVMIKQEPTAGSPYAMMAVTPGNGFAFQHHFNTTISGGPYTFPDAWVKLARNGNNIAAYVSADGVSWSQVGVTSVAMTTQITAGLFVASHNPLATSTVTFEDVTVTEIPPPDPPPPPWINSDIGSPATSGSAYYESGVFTVNGAGTDIWDTTDEFHYVYRSLSADGEIIARVTSQTPTEVWSKAGVMIKESAVAGAPYAMLAVTPGNGYAFQHSFSSHTSGGTYAFPDAWMKLTRTGNSFKAYKSSDGTAWSLVGTATIAMSSNVTVGLFVMSHVPTELSAVTFDNVTVDDYSLPPPWANTDVGSPAVAGSSQYTNGTFTVSGAGDDIWGTSDQFHYLYRPLSGDGEIIARAVSLTPTESWTKAGVMIKEATAAGTAYAMLAVTPANGYAFQHSFYSHTSAGTYSFPNAWVKLSRNGNTINGYTSVNGVNWTPVGTATIAMQSSVTVGLFVVSHVGNQLATATFDNVVVAGVDDDADGVPNGSDNCPAWANPTQSLPAWTVPAGDADCDGFPDTVATALKAAETTIGTVPTSHCMATSGVNDEPPPDAWPPDFNDNRLVNGSDWLSFNLRFGTTPGDQLYDVRWDLNGNGLINGADMLQLNQFMFKTCA